MPKIIWEKLFNSWINRKFLFVRREGSKVIVSRWSSPYRTTSEITKIVKKSNLFYQAKVTYTVKSVYTNTVKKQVKAVYTVKSAGCALWILCKRI